ncbi:MFS transporter [Thalassospira marina]|uniref:MFS transporter n=1 Tax=Thalassospira marina TaxID=2048283 RepID=A0ABM6Q8A2_9PROT|nr:MFS transporter [Thalassospira marina]AUG52778.1 MFS transporter [Thalassospira marina]
MLLLTNGQVRLLFIAQALYWVCSMVGITLTSLVGVQLAPYAGLATLPLGLLVLGNLGGVQPISIYMQRHGRRAGLMAGALCGVIGALVASAGVWMGSFTVFCIGAVPIGIYQASARYYRYVALEAVESHHKGRAAAYVTGGGVLAALVAPELAVWARDALVIPFLGAYLVMVTMSVLAIVLLARVKPGDIPPRLPNGGAIMRELLLRPKIFAAVAISAIGQGVMVLIMTATPLAMKFCGFDIIQSSEVIRWHFIGMFLPAFVAGPLIDRLGAKKVATFGSVILLISGIVALGGIDQSHFLISSLLLGLGWNLMLLAGTTLLGEGHDASERGHAQAVMELANGFLGAAASFAAGMLIVNAGWDAVNIGLMPAVLVGLVILVLCGRPARVTS